MNILTIDLGGTKTALGLFKDDVLEQVVKLDTPQDPNDLLVLLQAEIAKLDEAEVLGVGAAGYWGKLYILKQSLHLPKYIDYPLWSKLSAALDLPLYLRTDVELAAMGEAIYGLDDQYSNVLYINMGTGFSAGLYKDGEIFSTDYSPTLRLDFMVQPGIDEDSDDRDTVAILASTLINLACILSPQVIALGGGKVEPNWDSMIQPAIDQAQEYLSTVLSYPLIIQKSSLEYPTLYGANKLAQDQVIPAVK